MEYRIEHDSMGEVKVPADKYWAAQTERSHENFPIGVGLETMPREITHAFGILKQAAARANHALKPEKMTAEKLTVIEQACQEVASGKLNDHFPLVVWQTGSGTQSNMNANEVIANRGNELAGKKLLHPNDDINMSQSSNDTFPTAMHIAAVLALEDKVLPAIDKLAATFRRLEEENEGIVKSGRTHLQDMGNDVAVGMAASQGNFELNVFMPVCIYNFLQSARLLAESIESFNDRCAFGIRANREKMAHNLHNSLMLVTALNPYIGYENAAKTAKKAYKENISLKEACVALGFLTAEKFDEVFHPEQMV